MSIWNLLSLLGGLALFLYGMQVMGDGLTKLSGGRLEKILENLTRNPLLAVLLGAAVTAVIQSSSATTVMVVGFVNAGLMTLSQTVGIIMGANIGTTVTSWLLALTGIESDNFFVKLLKPSSFAPVLAAVGIGFMMFAKSERKHTLAQIFLGFAVLMTGMTAMSDAVKPLANVPEFTGILTRFSNPILGLLAGALLTAVIQSSSASIGILQALCATGAIRYAAALPIIMGQNIGTCITALLSGLGASQNARRAALIHLYFNVIGTLLFMLGFYAADAVVGFDFLSETAGVGGIAAIHTAFNLTATVLLLPFGRQLEKLAVLTIRDGGRPEPADDFQPLDERFLTNPAVAVQQAVLTAGKMCEIVRHALQQAFSLLEGPYDDKTFRQVQALEKKADHYEDHLGSYLVRLSRCELSEEDGRRVSILLHSIGDLERMSDHAVELAQSAREIAEKKLSFSAAAKQELQVLTAALRDMITRTASAFIASDLPLAATVEPLEQVIDELNARIKKNHIERLKSGVCTMEMGFILSDISTGCERIADHCSNIAVCQIQVHRGSLDTHRYRSGIQHTDGFDEAKAAFARRYPLP